ncbi:hypothetical protein SAMD00019534_034840 [Acytostelium subglobosum LB1]|uniref:hypothetical protein n=1 Tax=Acytostelium subglobosum LB1 TaxID=1410327 RepID=UPI0006451AA8|nr:hypothetical protein SAMD00019534_034840 [Acytostelium subglobosum LB1]GAM20309.1 hypothetical protein SAMD00019534_034840 [Acytostelium subglobosum LB1]|eukprot:XP_012759830.1 hypothetical protein SAMD00019534_034840 [Acytostelium subglobosum LB1]
MEQDLENLRIENDDEFAGIEELTKEELIDTIKDIREEYFVLKDKYRKNKDLLVDRKAEIDFQRKLLSEREDLLLQLQWDPSQDNSYLTQIGAENADQANELKVKQMLDQMRIMEKGIFDRDEKIASLQKMVETLTLNQINGANLPSHTGGIEMVNLSSNSNNTTPTVTPLMPTVSRSISDYPLAYKPKETVDVSLPSIEAPALSRQPSFWQSPTQFISYWVGWGEGEENEDESNNTEEVPTIITEDTVPELTTGNSSS